MELPASLIGDNLITDDVELLRRLAAVALWVTAWAPEPSALATHTSMLPLRLLAQAMREPSGLNDGAKAWLDGL